MSDDPKPPVNPPATPPKDEPEKVSPEAYKQVTADLHRFKQEAADAKRQLQEKADAEMKQNNQWKEYAEAKEKEANDWKKKFDTLGSTVTGGSKLSKIKEEAMKLGLREEAMDDLELMEFKDVVVETTSTGRVNVIGARAAAEKLKTTKPHWFGSSKPPDVNLNPPEKKPGEGGAKITIADLNKAEVEAKKTGDYREYRELQVKYKQQK